MPFDWKNSLNQPADDLTWGGKNIAIHYYDDGNWAGHPEILILINMEQGPVDQIVNSPTHSYTRRLMSAVRPAPAAGQG